MEGPSARAPARSVDSRPTRWPGASPFTPAPSSSTRRRSRVRPRGSSRQRPNSSPCCPAGPAGADRFRPLELYAGAQFGGWALTVGKQELWWGPGEAGPLSFSSNAEPFYSFRLTSTAPVTLPGFLRRLGGFRLDLIGGKLSGHQSPARPLLNGQKLTWNVTKDLELGFTRWSLFGGSGVRAFTPGAVLRNLFANGATFGSAVDPGDRKSGFDFRWRLPWYPVTVYSDFYADDEPSPLTSPRRSAFSPGIYLASLPALPKWDLRIEAPSTRLASSDRGRHFPLLELRLPRCKHQSGQCPGLLDRPRRPRPAGSDYLVALRPVAGGIQLPPEPHRFRISAWRGHPERRLHTGDLPAQTRLGPCCFNAVRALLHSVARRTAAHRGRFRRDDLHASLEER